LSSLRTFIVAGQQTIRPEAACNARDPAAQPPPESPYAVPAPGSVLTLTLLSAVGGVVHRDVVSVWRPPETATASLTVVVNQWAMMRKRA
jgi:hypothetical protein